MRKVALLFCLSSSRNVSARGSEVPAITAGQAREVDWPHVGWITTPRERWPVSSHSERVARTIELMSSLLAESDPGDRGRSRSPVQNVAARTRRARRFRRARTLVTAVLGLAGLAAGTGLAQQESSRSTLASPLSPVNAELQSGLERTLVTLGLDGVAADGRLGVALVDLTDGRPRAAMINGDRMYYAASLPKIAILLCAFEAIEQGRMSLTPRLRRQLTQMIRVSDNAAATTILHTLGFDRVARTLQRVPYRFYDRGLGGGLWVGKAYAKGGYWRRDPLAQLYHAATPRQTARFFVLLDQGRLVSETASAQMKRILGNPGTHHKFVRGLDARPGAEIYRKAGSWGQYHADAALVERPDARYVAVGLVEDPRGGEMLERLIVGLDDLIRRAAPRR